MSWNTAKKRFQVDLSRYPKYLRPVIDARLTNPSLPTFDNRPPVPKHEKKTSLETIGIAPGDLAYIASGEFKGRVSSVVRYNPDSDTFMLADVLEKKITPRAMWTAQQQSFLVDIPREIPAECVRLAAKDRDESGSISYVVAQEVVHKGKYYDPSYYRWMPRRFVKHHENIEIPWPKPPVDAETDALSTPAEAALTRSYELQTIARSPLPSGVLAELRNPHSRHKKRVLTEVQARRVNAPQMPLSKEQQAYVAQKAAAPKRQLEPLAAEVQDYIGARMAQHLATVEHPALVAHLDAVSSARDAGFARVMREIGVQSGETKEETKEGAKEETKEETV